MTVFADSRVDNQVAALAAKVDRPAGENLQRDLLRELAAEISKPDITYPVRTRPGWSVRFSTVVDADLLREWTRQAMEPDGLNEFQLALLVIAGQCRCIAKDGNELPLTFTHPELQDLYNSIDASTTVRKFYGDDVLVGATYRALLEAAGSGERLDPTTESSG